MTEKQIKKIPEITTPLRNSIIEMPDIIRKASGIVIYGKRIKSIVYSLDVSLLANTENNTSTKKWKLTVTRKENQKHDLRISI